MFFLKRSHATQEQERATPAALPCLQLHRVKVTTELPTGGTRDILNRLTIKLTARRTAVLGLNGSGKSTFLGLFNALVLPTSGTVTVCGIDTAHEPQTVRKMVGMIFSDPAAQLIMPTVIEDLELSLRRHHALNRANRLTHARELLHERGLTGKENQSVFSLSGGEKQLVALTSVLATEPRILLLDEPTTLLDLRNRLRLIAQLNELEQMLIISTHDLEVAQLCDEALIIHDGQLVAHGKAQEVIEQYTRYSVEGFPNEAPHRISVPPKGNVLVENDPSGGSK